MRGESATGTGVMGRNNAPPATPRGKAAVFGENTSTTVPVGSDRPAAGVHGESINGPGVFGRHTSMAVRDPAVIGRNVGMGSGVSGEAHNGPSVHGFKSSPSQTGPGVRGIAPGPTYAGVLALSGIFNPLPLTDKDGTTVLDCGLALKAVGHTVLTLPPDCPGPALRVEGPSVLGGAVRMPIGAGTIPAGSASFLVAGGIAAGATFSSHVSVALTGDPGPPVVGRAAVSWIERMAGQFRIHLTRPVANNTPFSYTVVNLPPP